VAAFVQDANEAALAAGSGPTRAIHMVGSTAASTAARLADQGGRYRLLVRGLQDGARVDDVRVVTCIVGATDMRSHPEAVWQAAEDPDLRAIVSNATEAGYASGPDAFPARLLDVLVRRAQAGLPGVTVLPCELVERNAEALWRLVRDEAAARALPSDVTAHVLEANRWVVTLVDRIVTTPPATLPAVGGDPLAVAAEPYASWVVELSPGNDPSLPAHPAIRRVPDASPFALRKIRILNGAHTALVARTAGGPWALVREAMDDADVAGWLEDLLREEVVPALGDGIDEGQGFVTSVLERFRNPYLDHRLADIASGHTTKVRTRLMPTCEDYRRRFGRPPARLAALLASEAAA
jgi:tagaturonate reductase